MTMTVVKQSSTYSLWLAALMHLSRFVLAVVGGYYLSAALAAWLAQILAWAGLLRSEAVVLCAMLGFVIYLVALLWAYAEQRWSRIVLMLFIMPLCLQGLALLWLANHGEGL